MLEGWVQICVAQMLVRSGISPSADRGTLGVEILGMEAGLLLSPDITDMSASQRVAGNLAVKAVVIYLTSMDTALRGKLRTCIMCQARRGMTPQMNQKRFHLHTAGVVQDRSYESQTDVAVQ